MYKESRFNIYIEKDEKIMVYNTLYQSFAEIEEKVVDEIKSISLDSEYKENFISLGFWVEDDYDEFMELKYESYKSVFTDKEVQIVLKLTEECNFNCVYCYQKGEKREMSTENFESLKKFILSKKNEGMTDLVIGYFGGEPLIKLDRILELEEFLLREKIRYKAHMTTNGSLLTNENIEKLKKTKIRSFQITIDGLSESHNKLRPLKSNEGSYSLVTENIVNLHKTFNGRVGIKIRININKANQDTFPEFLRELKENGIDNKLVNILPQRTEQFDDSDNDIYYEKTPEYSEQLLKIYKELLKWGQLAKPFGRILTPCSMNKKNYFFFNERLELEVCSASENIEQVIGRLNKEGRLEYFNEKRVIEKNLYLDNLDKYCLEECKFLPMCMGGCELKKMKEKRACIPEKFVMREMLLEYSKYV